MFGVLLVSCLTVCQSHYYDAWANHPDKRSCWCGERVSKTAPPPMEIHLNWKRGVDQSIDVVTPDPPKFPRYDILNITPGLEQPRESEDSDE